MPARMMTLVPCVIWQAGQCFNPWSTAIVVGTKLDVFASIQFFRTSIRKAVQRKRGGEREGERERLHLGLSLSSCAAFAKLVTGA